MIQTFAPLFTWMVLELGLTAALSAIYLLLKRFVATAADRYLFLKLAFAVVVFLPLVPGPTTLHLVGAIAQTIRATSAAAVSIQVLPETALPRSPFLTVALTGILVAYFCAFLLMVLRIFASSVKLTTLAEAAKPVTTRDGVPVLATDAKVPPATFGWIQPVILIPNSTLSATSADELEMVLAHEAQHIRSRDYLFNLMRALVQAALVFSPWIHWLGKRFIEDMELTCDAATLNRARYSAKSYGAMLLRLGVNSSPRTDLVSSGLFASNSFLSRRISAMKNLGIKRNRIVPAGAFAFLILIVGPALTSLGVDSAVESKVGGASSAATENQVVYRAIFNRKGRQGDSASGTIQLEDGVQREIEAGNVVLTLKPVKEGHDWTITVQGYDNATRKIVWNSKLVMYETADAKIESKLDAQEENDVSAISFSLSPRIEARQSGPKVSLVQEPDGRVYLNFKQPTEIKDLIKTMAQLTGKNVILDRDVQGKMTLSDPRPVTKQEAYQAFLQALRLLDLDVIETGRVIKIVNKTKAG